MLRRELIPSKSRIAKSKQLSVNIQEIGKEVRKKKDKALSEYTKQFDKVQLTSIIVNEEEIRKAKRELSPTVKKAIKVAKQNITTYHRHQYKHLQQKPITTTKRIRCYRKFSPIDIIGIYIPGGSAPLFSSVLMSVIPARIAKCQRIVVCTPPQKDGSIDASILYTASLCGCNEIFKVGGAQAIFAMAYGTETVPSVQKIVGPGNKYVNEAKKQVSATTPIDMPAGPSEVMIIADDSQHPRIIASDILSQLEHDTEASASLLCFSRALAKEVDQVIKSILKISKRKGILAKSIKNYTVRIIKSEEEAIEISNEYAPEHLIIATKNAKKIAQKITHAGSVFIGPYSAESIGDYASGTNHILPTAGYAKNHSGLSVESFGKWTSFQEVSKTGFHHIYEVVDTLSRQEGLLEHARAMEERKKWLP